MHLNKEEVLHSLSPDHTVGKDDLEAVNDL